MNVEPTVEIIQKMAKELDYRTGRIGLIATKMQDTQDLTYAAEVVNEIVSLITNLRLDLLITRPLKETMK